MYLTELTWTFNFLQEVDGNEEDQLREDESGEADLWQQDKSLIGLQKPLI